jgi:methenyltetrahydrofolate cyclohydrolase
MSNEKPISQSNNRTGGKDYLELSAKELLNAFGKGSHKPGSGSAAAYSGLMAIELMKTVILLSLEKPNYQKLKAEFELLHCYLVENARPDFERYFDDDIQVFSKVFAHRRLRDNAELEHEKNKNKYIANELLKEATDIPLDICEDALTLLQKVAFRVFDKGFKAVRGDSGVAISNLLSSAQGALFIVFLNLKSLQKSKWKDERMSRATELANRFAKLQREAFSRVITLYNENAVP